MRHGTLWTLMLLGLPHVADGTAGRAAAQVFADHEAAAARSAAPVADLPRTLDLRVVPPQMSPVPSPPADVLAPDAERMHRDHAGSGEGALSFGLELQRRRPAEARAWVDDENAPGLQDDIQRLIDRSALGVRGTYHF